jgi:hypothetical protein
LSFMGLKALFYYTWKLQKTWNTLVQ